MFPRRRSGRSPPRTHDGEPPWRAPPFWTGERSPPPPAFLERAWESPSSPFPVQHRVERPGRRREEGNSFRRRDFLVSPSEEPGMMRSRHVELPERRSEYRREDFHGAGPRFLERHWPAPSEAPMVRRRGVASPERYGEYNGKRPPFLEPSPHYSPQGSMERRRGDEFWPPSRFLAQSPPRYDERGRQMHRELRPARTSEGARPWGPRSGEHWCRGSPTPGRQGDFLESGDWPSPSEPPMVRPWGVMSPERYGEYNRKRPRFLEPSPQHYSTQGSMERRRGDDSSRFLAQSPMEWWPPRYDERGRGMHCELSPARTSEEARPWRPPTGERWCRGEFPESADWPSPSELPMVRPWGVASPDRHREYDGARPQDFLRQRPIHRGCLDFSRHSPMEHGGERSPPRILEGRRPWTPPPRDCQRRWGGLSEGPPRCIEVNGRSPPGTGRRVTEGRGLQGPHSWTEKTQGSPALSAGLGHHLLHAGGRSTSSNFNQTARGGGGGGGGRGNLPRRFVRKKCGIRQAVHEPLGGSGRPRSERQGIAPDPVNSALIEEKPHPQAKSDEAPIVGTSGDTLKGFFRLTGPADPSKIRPKAVLVEALKLLQASDRDYNFKTDQLKSIRQDLAIQNIDDDFSVQVYELHARLALSNRDMCELNVCLTRLQTLYQKLNDQNGEFIAYDILLTATQGQNIELMTKLGRLPNSLKQDKAVNHAQTVTESMRSGNYVQFFKLYKAAPNLNGQLMGLSFEKIRYGALQCMAKAYEQKVPVMYIANILGFGGVPETVDWLQKHGAVTCSEETGEVFLPKESAPTQAIPETPDDIGVLQSLKIPT